MTGRLTLTCVLLLFPVLALPASAAVLRGRVYVDRVGGPPGLGVTIASQGANPTSTDSHGMFFLQFDSKEPGEQVEVAVQKPGYAVVNSVQLRAVLPRNPDLILSIIIATDGKREEMARRYYGLRSTEAIEQFYEKRLMELDVRSREYGSERERLLREREDARAAANEASQELARLRPERISDQNRQAFEMFLDGRIDEALAAIGRRPPSGRPVSLSAQIGWFTRKTRDTDGTTAFPVGGCARVYLANVLELEFDYDRVNWSASGGLYRAGQQTGNFSATFSYNEFGILLALSSGKSDPTRVRLFGGPAIYRRNGAEFQTVSGGVVARGELPTRSGDVAVIVGVGLEHKGFGHSGPLWSGDVRFVFGRKALMETFYVPETNTILEFEKMFGFGLVVGLGF